MLIAADYKVNVLMKTYTTFAATPVDQKITDLFKRQNLERGRIPVQTYYSVLSGCTAI